jgi:Transposase zinc-ribbon domain
MSPASLNAPHFHDDDAAREYLEAVRWPDGPVCPHCGVIGGHYQLEGKAHRKGLCKCSEKECRKQFSVTIGTVFERSHIQVARCCVPPVLIQEGHERSPATLHPWGSPTKPRGSWPPYSLCDGRFR